MLLSTAAVVVVSLSCATASPLKSDFVVKHTWTTAPDGWSLEGPAPADHTLNLRIGLKEGNIAGLIDNLYAVSNPSSPRYGKHLSKAEVDALVAPSSETTRAVDAWLSSVGINPSTLTRSTAGDWLQIPVTVSQAQTMLNTNYSVFRHTESGKRVVRTLAWSLPSSVHQSIDVVEPTTMFARPPRPLSVQPGAQAVQPDAKTPKPQAIPPSSCNTVITPSCLRTLYNTANYTPAATSQNSLGVAGYLGEFANRADLQTFFQSFRTDAVGSSYTTTLVNGGLDDQSNPGVEANLDIQYTTGMSFPTPNTYYSTGGSPPFIPDSATPTNTNEPYIDWLTFILNQPTVPQTFTTSYGDDEQTVPLDYATRVCNSFAQLGARGSSIMFSSGDSGVGAGSCLTNDGTNKVKFQPTFPASCPFVTSVGGTIRVNPEQAVSFSSGGFSNYFARPTYQDAAVTSFLNNLGTKFSGLYNASGRGFPDVAAQGQGFQVVIGGTVNSVGGTSASSPTFAGVISLVNDARIARNAAPLGFLNPLIYTQPGAFNDITKGNNPGCKTTGFSAIAGWDAVTGLGTPNFLKLVAL